MARILVIEDDRVQRFAAVRALQTAGHDVLEAADGAEGLEVARQQEPDLIVCDVRMPGMTGYEVVRDLRRDAHLYTVPVILLSMMTERENVRLGMAAGADDYLTKPFRFEELCEAVSVLLRKRKAYQDQAASVMGPKFEAALREQRRELADEFEGRLLRELDRRWSRGLGAGTGRGHAESLLVLVDAFGHWEPDFARPEDCERAYQRYQGARDALNLFAPSYLLPAGRGLLAVFVEDGGALVAAHAHRALRAGLAAAARLPAEPGSGAVAMHIGPIALLRVADALHGDADVTLVSGDGPQEVRALLGLALRSDLRVSCSPALAALAGPQVQAGTAVAEEALKAIEVLGVDGRD